MIFGWKHTFSGGRASAGHIILGLIGSIATAIAISGCATAPNVPVKSAVHRAPTAPPPGAIVYSDSAQPARVAAEQELGPAAAKAILPAPAAAPRPSEPVAQALVRSMLNSLTTRIVDAEGVTRIGVNQLRNQSHSGPAEFAAFTQRLAELLTGAGREWRVEFVADSSAAAHYQLQGAAYLISAQGFDVWELFLSLTPTSPDWTVWQSPKAVRVLRQPRPGETQFLP